MQGGVLVCHSRLRPRAFQNRVLSIPMHINRPGHFFVTVSIISLSLGNAVQSTATNQDFFAQFLKHDGGFCAKRDQYATIHVDFLILLL